MLWGWHTIIAMALPDENVISYPWLSVEIGDHRTFMLSHPEKWILPVFFKSIQGPFFGSEHHDSVNQRKLPVSS